MLVLNLQAYLWSCGRAFLRLELTDSATQPIATDGPEILDARRILATKGPVGKKPGLRDRRHWRLCDSEVEPTGTDRTRQDSTP